MVKKLRVDFTLDLISVEAFPRGHLVGAYCGILRFMGSCFIGMSHFTKNWPAYGYFRCLKLNDFRLFLSQDSSRSEIASVAKAENCRVHFASSATQIRPSELLSLPSIGAWSQ